MSESNERRDRLAALMADSLAQDALEGDLLLRYANDPDSLESEARQRIESYLAASPAHRQQLRSLKRFADTQGGLVEAGSSEPRGQAGGGSVAPIASHPRWRTRAVVVGSDSIFSGRRSTPTS